MNIFTIEDENANPHGEATYPSLQAAQDATEAIFKRLRMPLLRIYEGDFLVASIPRPDHIKR